LLAVVAALVGGLEINFGTLGCSAVRALPCTCWYGLSTQTFGEERRSLYSLVFGLETDVVEVVVVGVELELDAFVLETDDAVVDSEQVAAVAEGVGAGVEQQVLRAAAELVQVLLHCAAVPAVPKHRAAAVAVVQVEVSEQAAEVSVVQQAVEVSAQAVVEVVELQLVAVEAVEQAAAVEPL